MKINRTIVFLMTYFVTLGVFVWVGYYSFADYVMHAQQHQHMAISQFETDLAYVDLPHISVTLTPMDQNSRSGIVRMDITLEVENQFKARIVNEQPRITDRLVHYTENLSYDDIARPRSTVWLKPDMLVEINKITAPVPVRGLIFKEFVAM
jgi:flagellar basal body-associated protein FliL